MIKKTYGLPDIIGIRGILKLIIIFNLISMNKAIKDCIMLHIRPIKAWKNFHANFYLFHQAEH